MKWNYVIPIEDKEVFEKIESLYGISVPEELKNLVLNYNAGSPEKYHIMINGNERVFGALLSFNKDDDDDFYTAFDNSTNKEMIPFGIDPFGNLFCVSTENGHIYFYNHEIEIYEELDMDLIKFCDSMF